MLILLVLLTLLILLVLLTLLILPVLLALLILLTLLILLVLLTLLILLVLLTLLILLVLLALLILLILLVLLTLLILLVLLTLLALLVFLILLILLTLLALLVFLILLILLTLLALLVFLILLALLVFLILLILFLFVLVAGLLCLLLRLLPLLFQLFDLLFQLLHPTAVGGEASQVVRRAGGRGKALPVKLFGISDPVQGLIQHLQGRVELLRLDRFQRLVQCLFDVPVGADAEIVQRAGADFAVADSLADRLFIQRSRLLVAGQLALPRRVVQLRRRRSDSQKRQRQPEQLGAAPFERPFPGHQIKEEQQRRRAEQQREIVVWNRLLRRLLLRPAEPVDPADDRREPGIGHRAADIDPAGFRRELPQLFFVEPAGRQLSLGGAFEAAAFVRNRRGNARVAEPEDEERNLPLLQFRDRSGAVARELVPVGHEQDRPVAGRSVEGVERDVDRQFEVRAADRNDGRPEFVDVLFERRLVRGQRAGQKGASREGHDAEPVVAGFLHELPQQVFGVFEPGRGDVGRPHAFRYVEQDKDIPAECLVRNDPA